MNSMDKIPYLPIFELTRGGTVESIHYGAIAVVDVHGRLIASYGDPETVTFLRSSAKPFQALPFFESKGPQQLGLTTPEKAIICASHSGTDEHYATVKSIQAKAKISEKELMCGIHEPEDKQTAMRMHDNHEPVTPNRHNCSGKHTGMLAYLHLKSLSGKTLPEDIPYIDPTHPLQKEILQTFAEMCGLTVEQVQLGVDGCSAPNFAIPLRNAALAYARLCDPMSGGVRPVARVEACREIFNAMTSSPEMVSGPGRFDTRLMEIAEGKIVSKGGAEGYHGIGILPGVIGQGSPAIGIATKISDGDDRNKVSCAVTLEVLRQLGALSPEQLSELEVFGPGYTLENFRKITVGHAYPTFRLVQSDPIFES
jgi:L-asparaginase II